MSGFEDFVTVELPKRPFTSGDGLAGQALVRSNNPLAPRQCIWVDIDVVGGSAGSPNIIELEMGETLTQGTPVRIAANKLYAADNLTNFRVIGLLINDCEIGLLGSVETAGKIAVSGLIAGEPYYLGAGVITNTAPSTGYVIRVGQALTGTLFIVSIEPPILLD